MIQVEATGTVGIVTYSAPAQGAPAAQARVDAAAARIDGIQSQITSITAALAAIQEAIALLEAQIVALRPPDPNQYSRFDTRTEGNPPRTVRVRVFDSAAFNGAMSRYLAELNRLRGEVQSKRGELARKEGELAAKERELSRAEAELTQAQRQLEAALQNDQRALAEAQQRYREAMERADEARRQALEAQAQAQKAQDELQKADEDMRKMEDAAYALGGYDAAEAAELRRELRGWDPDSGAPPPYAHAPQLTEQMLNRYSTDSTQALAASLAAVASAKDHLPRLDGAGNLLPPVVRLSAADYIDLTPRLASVTDGVTARESGLLTDLVQSSTAALTTELLDRMVSSWRAAGFSEDQIRTSLEQLVGPQSSGDMSPEDYASALRAIETAHTDAYALVSWLEEHPDPALRCQMFDLMAEWQGMGMALNLAAKLGPETQELLAASLGIAYLTGSVTDAEFAASIRGGGDGEHLGESHLPLMQVVLATGSTSLLETFALREIEIAATSIDDNDAVRAAVAAQALATLPPAELQAFLADHPDEVATMMPFVNASYELEGPDDTLAALLGAARAIAPPTPESLNVFSLGALQIGENVAAREAAARFYLEHADELYTYCQTPNGAINSVMLPNLEAFFAYMLFTEPDFASRDAVRGEVTTRLNALMNELNGADVGDGQVVPDGLVNQARFMGSFVGVLETSFYKALAILREKNEDIDDGVDFMADVIIGWVPDTKLPGPLAVLGSPIDATRDEIAEGIKDRIKDELHYDAGDPWVLLPFHRLYGENLRKGSLATNYESPRGAVYDDWKRRTSTLPNNAP